MKAIWMTLFLGATCILIACSATLPAAYAASSKLQQSFNDTDFALKSCELKSDRTVICRMTVNNHFTDKRVEITNSITIQDDLGNEYPVTSGGFGIPSTGPKWNQITVADSSYNVYVVAPNISSQATSVRAVVFPRLLVRSAQGQTLGYRDHVVFASPPMVVAEEAPEVSAEIDLSPAPETSPAAAKVTPEDAMPIAFDEWQVVGLWSYDGEDGQHIPSQGFVLHAKAGAGVGQAWLARLELKNHNQLPERHRALWPVMIHVNQRKVCANYPDYPTYPVFIDMPGIDEDAVYTVSGCKAE